MESSNQAVKSKSIYRYFEIFVIGLFFISAFTSLVNLTQLPKVMSFCRYIRLLSYVCLILLGILNLYRIDLHNKVKNIFPFLKSHIFLLIIGVVSLLTWYFSKNFVPVLLMIFAIGSKNVKKQKINKIFALTYLVGLAITILLMTYKFIPQNVIYRSAVVVRYSLGMIYPLETQTTFFFVAFYLLIQKRGLSLINKYFIFNYFNILFFYFTGARTSFLLFIFFSTFYLIYIRFKEFFVKHIKLISGLMLLAVGLIAIVYFAAMIDYPASQWSNFLDKLTSNRINYAKQALALHPVNLFGQTIEWIGLGGKTIKEIDAIGSSYNFVDCSYIKDLLDNGIAFYLIIVGFYIYTIYKSWNKPNTFWFFTVIIIVLIMCFMEARLIQIALNPVLFYISDYYFLSNQEILNLFRK